MSLRTSNLFNEDSNYQEGKWKKNQISREDLRWRWRCLVYLKGGEITIKCNGYRSQRYLGEDYVGEDNKKIATLNCSRV